MITVYQNIQWYSDSTSDDEYLMSWSGVDNTGMVMECRLPWKCSKDMDWSVKAAMTEMAIKEVIER